MIINTVEEAISRLRQVQLDSYYPPEHILHMILAGGPTQTLYNISPGIHQQAVEFLCRGTGNIPDYPIHGGIVKEDAQGRPYFSKGTGSFQANEHLNEFLGTLAVAGVHFNTPIVTDRGHEGTLEDMAQAAMQTYRDSTEEPSWSLMLFSVFPGVMSEWKNENGDKYNVERILQAAFARPYGAGSCFGTHAIEGISFAVSRYCLETDMEPPQLEGIWKRAYEYVLGAIHLMKKNQKEDGSIDRCWFRNKRFPRNTMEWKEKIKDFLSRRFVPAKAIVYPTGHCLDALSPLSIFLAERDWIDNACYIIAQTIQMQWAEIASEIPPLTHAVHALKLIGE